LHSDVVVEFPPPQLSLPSVLPDGVKVGYVRIPELNKRRNIQGALRWSLAESIANFGGVLFLNERSRPSLGLVTAPLRRVPVLCESRLASSVRFEEVRGLMCGQPRGF
jgi:hypothetical protein